MELVFELILKENKEAFELMAKWDNADDIKYFIRPNFNEGEIDQVSAEILYDNFNQANEKYSFFMIVNGEKVGYVSLDGKFPMLMGEAQQTGWLSICVGEKQARQMGLGKKAMHFIENQAIKLGYKRLELGVFAYNQKAISLYEKMGYTKIGEIEKLVYYQGSYHSDIRMEKWL